MSSRFARVEELGLEIRLAHLVSYAQAVVLSALLRTSYLQSNLFGRLDA